MIKNNGSSQVWNTVGNVGGLSGQAVEMEQGANDQQYKAPEKANTSSNEVNASAQMGSGIPKKYIFIAVTAVLAVAGVVWYFAKKK